MKRENNGELSSGGKCLEYFHHMIGSRAIESTRGFIQKQNGASAYLYQLRDHNIQLQLGMRSRNLNIFIVCLS